MTTLCNATTIWPDIPPHGVRLTCQLAHGHAGDHAGEIEYLPAQDVLPFEETR